MSTSLTDRHLFLLIGHTFCMGVINFDRKIASAFGVFIEAWILKIQKLPRKTFYGIKYIYDFLVKL